ncbi:ATP-binding protein [Rubricoccus marinus]|uniref:Histidine kinase/HSP90-like ATPase domain-containing protein n=1 Tax=Rubricoccus marinus TaxID=716817 RepID=A0A259U0Q0_9BACT|nr:ATP-binding protein [Rubricoccus marinus]OZC03579.1 hypothetical protein BSZ36_11660 [Rubricoccus marinus]
MPRRAHTLRIPGQTSELERVRRHVEDWAGEAGLSPKETRQLRTAVDEAVANAIEHGLDDQRDHITIRSASDASGLAVTVRHRGDRFDPTLPPVPLAEAREARAVHGYGLHLLKTLVDSLSYRFVRGANEVRLYKRKR